METYYLEQSGSNVLLRGQGCFDNRICVEPTAYGGLTMLQELMSRCTCAEIYEGASAELVDFDRENDKGFSDYVGSLTTKNY